MNEFYIRNVIEAALLAAGKPLQLAELGQLFDESTRPKTDDVRAALDALASEYANRGVEVKETAAGFRIQVRREFSAEISRLWPERPARYSRALLETLALIAYRQPITRAEIEAVRGVAVNPNIIKTVIERNWVRVVGHRDVPGRPELLGTTREFLDYFGLRSLDELPPLAEIKAMGDYNLQLELPNAGALGVEVSAEAAADGAGGEGEPVVATALAAGEAGQAGEEVAANPDIAAEQGSDELVATADPGLIADELVSDDREPESSASDELVRDEGAVVGSTDDGLVRDDGAVMTGAIDELSPDPGAQDAIARGDAELETDAEAELTLNAGETPQHATVETDESESSPGSVSSEFVDPVEDSPEDDADDDELSADGHGSRELVAAPRDPND